MVMAQWNGRIYVCVEDKNDWKKLLDMKLDESWALGDGTGKDQFGYCDKIFCITDEWSPMNGYDVTWDTGLGGLVSEIVDRIGIDKCVVFADLININTDPCYYIFTSIGKKDKKSLRCPSRKAANILNAKEWLEWAKIELTIDMKNHLCKFFEFDDKSGANDKELKVVNINDSIGAGEFRNRKDICEVVISDSVQEIGDNAFEGCENLEKMNIPGIEEWQELDGTPCYACYGWDLFDYYLHIGRDILKGTKIEQQYFNKHEGTFYYMGCLLKAVCEELRVREDTINIAWGAFQGVRKIILPPIGEYSSASISDWTAVEYRSCIEEIIFEDGVKAINDCCFEDLTSLRRVVIPESVVDIGDDIFGYDNDLISNVTWYVKKGSYAEEYAQENEIKYECE
jgi:hypothetical protein